LKRFLATSSLAVLSVLWLPGCLLHRHAKNDLPAPVAAGDQPDKILYERATTEIARGRYEVGRLTLQTLLNTYPDSEFLAKAKLAIADSYYNEGGISGLTQAEAEYKDFITFFPTAPEAPESQYRAGMCHFREMAKADRDRTEARLAEAEFKEFLLKYPDSRLKPKVKGRLREVQEVLGQSDYKIAQFYYLKQSNRAALSRFQEIADRYPDFSEADSAMWYLGQTFERLKTPKQAATYYSLVITDYPLSPHVDEAKERLTALHEPIPHATRAMIARAQADASHHVNENALTKLGGAFASSPNVSATRHGPVHLGPRPSEAVVAKTAPATPGGNIVVAEPVGESALSSGKAVETAPKPDGAKPAAQDSAAQGSPATQENATASKAQDSSDKGGTSSTPDIPKKKSRFSKLKKIVKPF
jgi:outer membrane protein assembly factor BamD